MTGWIIWLRGASLGAPTWNVDESIHATVAEVLLDGGSLYRDAIDQRTPFTYYFTAAVFAVSDSSLEALRGIILLMIIVGALALGLVARRTHGLYAGLGSAVVFAAFANFLLLPEDTFAAHTEWFVTFFTILSAWCFLSGKSTVPSLPRCGATGALLGLAVMSKQSALLDTAPALVALGFLTVDGGISIRTIASRLGAIIGAFLITCLLVSAPVLLSGGGADYLYYAWTYNLEIYGAEFTFLEKIGSGLHLIESVGTTYPLLLASGTIGLLWLIVRCLQFRPTDSARPHRFAEAYLVTWMITSTGAAMAGGRGFDHYFFPTLAPLAWICVSAPAVWLQRIEESSIFKKGTYTAAAALFVVLLITTFIPPLKARHTAPPPADPAQYVSDWIKAHSSDSDRIFVWGFNPDIYRYTDRLPAARFLYCTFQTGLIPWTNTTPELDTKYAVVDGSMETLLKDLQETKPKFVIDSSAGPHRFFGKYPLRKFPELESWLHRNYVELQPQRWGGFRLHIRSDAQIEASDFSESEVGRPDPEITGTNRLAPGKNQIGVAFSTTRQEPITGLGLALDGQVVTATTFFPLQATSIQINLDLSSDLNSARLRPLARSADHTWTAGPAVEFPVVSTVTTPEQRVAFAIPMISESVGAIGLRASFGARAEVNDGLQTFSMHAPAVLTYQIPAGVTRISGSYGLPAAAYASDNPSPSDGAEFIVRFRPSEGGGRGITQAPRGSVERTERCRSTRVCGRSAVYRAWANARIRDYRRSRRQRIE
ncbi:glycosyltransferase family 39 protein [Opitutaceae bacterium]|nr:glycosyltransferase family 39 protein [Opitutaceae bacterium]